jgi:hypothetical protein
MAVRPAEGAARAAGFRVELEVSNEARTWRANVLVFDGRERPFMAQEVQLSPMHGLTKRGAMSGCR